MTKTGTRLARRQHVRLCLVTILLGTTFCYGAFRVSTAAFRDGPKLALLQSNIEQRHKMKGDPHKIIAQFAGLVERAVARAERPDLIVWPETAYPYGYIAIDPNVDPADARTAGPLDLDRRSRSRIGSRGRRRSKTTSITGPTRPECRCWWEAPSTITSQARSRSTTRRSSSVPISPTIHFYHKMHLVPFGEYVPFIDIMPWLSILTPYHGGRVPSLSFGREPRLIPLKEYLLAVTICFEDTVPQVIGRFFAEAAATASPTC